MAKGCKEYNRMKNHDHVLGIPVSSVTYAAGELQEEAAAASFSPERKNPSVIQWMCKISRKADSYAKGIREHVSLGSNISQTVKEKLNLGARIIQAGGIESVFKLSFSTELGEKLLNAFQCYLSTTAGPIAGMLFISSEKIAFRSDRSIKFACPNGKIDRTPYKALIPLRKIKRASPSGNIDKPNQKYIQIVTEDEFEFWFMGFILFEKSFAFLQKAVSE